MASPRLINAIYPNFFDQVQGQAQAGWSTLNQSPASLGIYAPLITALEAITQCGLYGITFQQRAVEVTIPTSGPYSTVRDQAIFLMESQNYSRMLAVPGPKAAIFESDGVTVDLSNGDVVAFVNQVKAVLGDSYGSPWTVCKRGWRRRVKIGGT